MILPSQVISEDLVARLIADSSTDETTRAALRDRLASMQRPTRDPFAGVVQADYRMDEVF